MLGECDRLILAVVDVLEGERETEIVRRLLRLRDALTRQEEGHEITEEAEAARDELILVVNNFFYEKLIALPEIRDYMNKVQSK
jgi:hypothetical protein